MKHYIAKKYFHKLLFSFLLIGVLPLLVVGPITYILTKNILYRRAQVQNVTISNSIEQSLVYEITDYNYVISQIIHNVRFEELFTPDVNQEQLASFYDNLYLLIAGKHIKPGVHIVDRNFSILLNTTPTPREYYSEPFRSWGVIRKAILANGNPVMYYHLGRTDDPRALTLARIKLNDNGELVGIILIDLYKEHIQALLPAREEAPQTSILLLDEHNTSTLPIQGFIDDHTVSTIIQQPPAAKNSIQKGDGNSSYLFTLKKNQELAFSVLSYYPLTQIDELLHLMALITITLAGLMTFMCILLALFVSRNAAHPLQEVVEVLEKVGKGDFSARANIHRNDEFGELGSSVNKMVIKMKQLIDTNRQKEMSLRTSEIKSLMSQTKPHFIFNCLETIKWYILLGDAKEASQTIVELGYLLRSNLDLGEGIVTIKEEMEIIKKYLALQKRRLGDRIHITMEIDQAILAIRIPRLLFQPIIENAVMHGLEKKRGRGELSIKGYIEQNFLHVIVEDNGVGIPEEISCSILTKHPVEDIQEGGSGLQNLIRRLNLYYGENAGIHFHSEPDKGTRVSLYISLKVGL